jgi:hypothetical protein
LARFTVELSVAASSAARSAAVRAGAGCPGDAAAALVPAVDRAFDVRVVGAWPASGRVGVPVATAATAARPRILVRMNTGAPEQRGQRGGRAA